MATTPEHPTAPAPGAHEQLLAEVGEPSPPSGVPANGRGVRALRAVLALLLELHRIALTLRAIVMTLTGPATRRVLAVLALAGIVAAMQAAGVPIAPGPVRDAAEALADKAGLQAPPAALPPCPKP